MLTPRLLISRQTQAMCARKAVASLLLPWLRCAESSVPLLLTHVGVLLLDLVQGDLERHLGDGCGKANYHSPAIAASSAPEGCPPYSQRSLEEKTTKIARWDFVLDQDFIVLVSGTNKPILSAENKGFWPQVDLSLLIKLKEDKRSREEENYPPQVFLW